MGAAVTHFEINAKDAKRAQDFYSGLFDWKISLDPTNNYGMVDTGLKMGIGGGIGQAREGSNAAVTFYVQVEDVQAYLDKAISLGATVVMPLTVIPDMVTFAQFADPDGNIVGLAQGPQTDPKPKVAKAKKKKAPAKKKKTKAKKPAKKRKKRK